MDNRGFRLNVGIVDVCRALVVAMGCTQEESKLHISLNAPMGRLDGDCSGGSSDNGHHNVALSGARAAGSHASSR